MRLRLKVFRVQLKPFSGNRILVVKSLKIDNHYLVATKTTETISGFSGPYYYRLLN